MVKLRSTFQLLLAVLLIWRGLGKVIEETFMLPEVYDYKCQEWICYNDTTCDVEAIYAKSLLYSVKDMANPERYICKYLCRNMTPSTCRCRIWVPCLGKVCRKGAECRILGRSVKPQTLCCPDFQEETSSYCKNNFKKKVVTWSKRTKYYRFNQSRGGCELMTWYSNSVQTVEIPGYTTSQACTYCSLYTMCTGPVVTPL